MAELIFEPYTARLLWQASRPAPGFSWPGLVAGTLEAVAARCEVEGQTVIGHIKGLATLEDGQYLRANVVAAGQTADLAGAVPSNCTELLFTMNVLVYGLPYAAIAERVIGAAEAVAGPWQVAVTVEPVVEGHAPHHHHGSDHPHEREPHHP
jgi:hypothetical protein